VFVYETSSFALFTSDPKACMLHTSLGWIPLQDIQICSLGYVFFQFFMSLTVSLVLLYPLLFLEDVLYRVTIISPSLLLTLV
jgi:hypothetical protein